MRRRAPRELAEAEVEPGGRNCRSSCCPPAKASAARAWQRRSSWIVVRAWMFWLCVSRFLVRWVLREARVVRREDFKARSLGWGGLLSVGIFVGWELFFPFFFSSLVIFC